MVDISVIIEFDNSAFVHYPVWSKRMAGMLSWIERSCSHPIREVVFVFDEAQGEEIRKFLRESEPAINDPILLPLPREQAHYYAMKNAGAEIASGEILVFLDSDLYPMRGALDDLIAPLEDGSEVASCGYPCFPTDDFVSRAFSLFWVFPIMNVRESMYYHQLLVNNCAFERNWFLKNRFRTDCGGFKVACYLLAQKLEQDGYRINHADVWFEHDVWNRSWRFFVWRASVMGRDADRKYACHRSSSRIRRLLIANRSLLSDIIRTIRRNFSYGRGVGLSYLGILSSTTMGLLFYLIVRSSQAKSALRVCDLRREPVPADYVT